VGTSDEEARGLFIVTQMAEWRGTRYTAAGKIIWTEQLLPRCSILFHFEVPGGR
jgi:hypothetical protein